jgi:putative phage-type endonuclease
MKIIHDVLQGSDEWLAMRLGKITASRFKDVMTNGIGGSPSKTAESYMIELAIEAVTGKSLPFFENDAMRHGTETEPKARLMYELMTGNDVAEVAFIEHNEFVGVSPDGLIGVNGGIEIKCPNTKTQVERYLGAIGLPDDYKWQVHGCIWVAEREWWDFVSFDDRIDTAAQYLCTRVYRDEKIIKELDEKVKAFSESLQEMIIKLSKPLEI